LPLVCHVPSRWRSRLESVRPERGDLMSPLPWGQRHSWSGSGRTTALRPWVVSVAGDILSQVRHLTWQPGSGGLRCWDLDAGASLALSTGTQQRGDPGGSQ